jgi:SPX domain protein involved in polyphosphate accumulation
MRLEYKYLIPVSLLSHIRSDLLPFLEMDKYAGDKDNKEYTVRSIYFDTPQMRYYFEKVEGIKIRKKVRIRSYDEYESDKTVFLEIKRKNQGYISKHRSKILLKDVDNILQDHKPEDYIINTGSNGKSLEDARMFLFYFKHENLRPSVLITYEREAFFGKFNKDLRITFDKNLRFLTHVDHSRLFEESDLQPALNDKLILEIKFRHSFPLWLQTILSRYNLQRLALSKYVICLEADKKNSINSILKKIKVSTLGSQQYVYPEVKDKSA